MKLDINYLLNEKKEIVSVALLGLIILLAVLVLLKVTSFFAITAKAQRVVADAIIIAKTPATIDDFRSDRQIVSALTANNIFNAIPQQIVVVQQTQRNPVTEVRAIVGDEASINGAWYRVGETVGQARIVAIEPTEVTIEYDNELYVLRLIDASMPQTQQNLGSSGMQVVNNSGSMTTVGGQTFGRGGRGSNNMMGVQNMSQAEIQRLRDQMTGGFGGGMMGGGMMGGGMGGGMMGGGGRTGGMGGGRGGGMGGGGRGGRGG